jgi:hypothetical protein
MASASVNALFVVTLNNDRSPLPAAITWNTSRAGVIPAIGFSVLAECYPMKQLLTLLIVLLIPTAALAKGECRDERKKFCAGMVKKQLWDCLRKHEAELGAPCKTKIEARAKAKEERGAGAAAGANYSSPSTDTQPQPSYPDGKTQ